MSTPFFRIRPAILTVSLAGLLGLTAVPGSAQRFGGITLRAPQNPVQAQGQTATPPPQPQTGTPARPTNPQRNQVPSAERYLSSEWWKDEDTQKELKLTPRQVQRISGIFEGRLRDFKPYYDDFLKQIAELDRITRERTVDVSTYSVQVTRVEGLRSKLNETRSVMLYRIYRELEPAQYDQLQKIWERRMGRRGGGPGPRPW